MVNILSGTTTLYVENRDYCLHALKAGWDKADYKRLNLKSWDTPPTIVPVWEDLPVSHRLLFLSDNQEEGVLLSSRKNWDTFDTFRKRYHLNYWNLEYLDLSDIAKEVIDYLGNQESHLDKEPPPLNRFRYENKKEIVVIDLLDAWDFSVTHFPKEEVKR